jgi:FAD/FMN-containing dehydrogenase
MNDIVTRLSKALGPEVVTPGAHTPERSMHDWSGLAPARPLALLRPRNTTEVATALRLCNETGTPVVPQGGLSGISGGAHPVVDAVSISLERMNAIESIDREMATITLGAGTVLQTAQEAAAEHDLLLGVDLGARGSCTVGGVISTNAGGNQVIRYGMTRDHVLGVEAVLADGTIVSSMNTMIKNNAGLDLKQLFIGSEGLMGIVTRAVMRLHPRPAYTGAAFCGCPDTASVIALLKRARASLGPQLTSFEVMWPSFFDFMSNGIGVKNPLAAAHGVYVIVEASGFAEAPLRTALEACLEGAFEAAEVGDAVIAASAREEKELWAVRESVAEYGRLLGPITAFDVGVPLASMASAVTTLEADLKARWPDVIALFYGHLGDSNLHLVVNVPSADADQPAAEIKALVYGRTRDLGGTVSAEHGIGVIKRAYLEYSRSPEEIATMRAVKRALDPKNIMNPGKGFST